MKNIKLWDKIVYDWYITKKYILVEEIKDFKSEEWSIITLINWIYCISWPLREPTLLELEVWKFKWMENKIMSLKEFAEKFFYGNWKLIKRGWQEQMIEDIIKAHEKWERFELSIPKWNWKVTFQKMLNQYKNYKLEKK